MLYGVWFVSVQNVLVTGLWYNSSAKYSHIASLMTHRILSVEQSASMRLVIEKHAQSLGYEVQSCRTYTHAADLLSEQYQAFNAQFSGVIFGWPTAPQEDATEFAKQLESNDHKDLPVVVMSPDLRAETRAWVAGRDSTALLPWKKYKALDQQLKKLIAVNDDVHSDLFTGSESALALSSETNNDIHLLLVDESASIRYALRDLFLEQGYQVSLAASFGEAHEISVSKKIDIVIADYYLSDATGDALCLKLMLDERVGEIVCTILTSDHSDPVIKRCLRAGALDCINKNESSELLLSRIGAISRFMRQKRVSSGEPSLLDEIVEHTAGSIIVIGEDNTIVYASSSALQLLGDTSLSNLIGNHYKTLLVDELPENSEGHVSATSWELTDGSSVKVDYRHSLLGNNGHRLLSFARHCELDSQALPSDQLSIEVPDSAIDTAIREFSLPDDCSQFLRQMLAYLDSERQRAGQTDYIDEAQDEPGVSLFVIDVFLRAGQSAPVPLSQNDEFAKQIKSALLSMLTKEHHVTAFSDSRFAFLLRHSEETQSYVLTRKVMQRCLELQKDTEKEPEIVCSGCLLSLSKNSAQSLNAILQDTILGLELVRQKEVNQAILLDVRRLLSAYPVAET